MAVFVFGLGLAAYAVHEIIPSGYKVPYPAADAERVNEYLIKYNPYRAWAMWPGKGKLYKAAEPHGALLTTFVNDVALESIKNKKGMVNNSIIAKENYTADEKFVGLTVMYKVKGYNPEAGDWFWAKYRPDGTAEVSGKVKMCIDCHSKAKDNDFIMTSKVK
ncbi:MAG: cytochrome P460 family protein [Nitrospirae bacterium]|nr:cytochrome P460 family protein [Nitrospirota bacterium]